MTTEREQKLELDIAALRAELAILMDCINELPDEALDTVPTHKIHKAFLAMSEADKHEHTKTQIDKVMAENDRLREIVAKVAKLTAQFAAWEDVELDDVPDQADAITIDHNAMIRRLISIHKITTNTP